MMKARGAGGGRTRVREPRGSCTGAPGTGAACVRGAACAASGPAVTGAAAAVTGLTANGAAVAAWATGANGVTPAGGEESEAAKSLLRIVKTGDYFGERALLADEKRSATVTAASKVRP